MKRLTAIGRVTPKSAKEVNFSRLGIGFEKLDRGLFDPNKAYDKVAMLGIKWVRIQSGWMRTEREKGVYDFAWIDEIVDNLLTRGLKPWINLSYGNPIYTEFAKQFFGAVGCPPVDTEEENAAWDRYVTALVSHMAGRVTYFEIWNESDCNYSWRHKASVQGTIGTPSGKEYGEFVIRTAKVIRTANPEAKIIGLATGSPFKHFPFLLEALETGMADHIDAASFHVYSSRFSRRHDAYRAFAHAVHAHNPKVEIIQGESGVHSAYAEAGAICRMNWTPEKQTKFLVREMMIDLSYMMLFTSYFSAMDMAEALHGVVSDKRSFHDYGYYGIIGAEFDENGIANGTYYEKPSYFALQTIASLFAEDYKAVDLPYVMLPEECRYTNQPDYNGSDIELHTFELADGRKAFVYWRDTDLLTETYQGTVSLQIPTRQAPELIDLSDGTIYKLPDDMVTLGKCHAHLHHIPLTDAPLMLVWKD